jgi:hypothetical protein
MTALPDALFRALFREAVHVHVEGANTGAGGDVAGGMDGALSTSSSSTSDRAPIGSLPASQGTVTSLATLLAHGAIICC